MPVFKKLLVGIDGSEESLHAFEEAVKFAKDKNIGVFVLSVAPVYCGDLSFLEFGVSLQELNENESYKEALDVAKQIASRYQMIIQPLYEEGEPYEKILDISEELSVDLIVMGKKGVTALEQILMGSVTERVIGYSKIDVLVVSKYSSIRWNRVVVATDGSKYSEVACDKALQIAKEYGCQVNIVSVVDFESEVFVIKPDIFDVQLDRTKKYLDLLKERFVKEGIQSKTFVLEGEPYEQIVKIANQTEADIIITGSHGRTGLRRLLMGSTCQRVIGLSKVPVLVVK